MSMNINQFVKIEKNFNTKINLEQSEFCETRKEIILNWEEMLPVLEINS